MSDKVKLEAKPLEIRPSPASPSAKMKLAPKLELKPSARGGLLDGPGQIVTSKEWVLPPRPKPGRKPSSDTPPSKRKAQNRAAQRAFRERRAQRVSELEDKLQEVETERDAQENVLKDALKDVSSENQLLRESLEALRREVMSIKEQRTPTGTTPQHSPQYPPPQPPQQANHLPRPYYSQYMPAYSPHQVTSPMTMEPTSPYHRNSFGSFSFQSYGAYSPRYESNPASPSEHTTTATSVGDHTLETLDRVLDTKMVRRDSHVSNSGNVGHMHPSHPGHVTPSIPISSLTEKTVGSGPVAPGRVPGVSSTAGNVSGAPGGVSGASGASGVGGCGSVPRVQSDLNPAPPGSHVVDPDCIICTKEECACAAIGQQKAVMGTNDDDDFSSFKPLPAVPLKRSLEMEMDFTSSFKTRHPFKKRKDSCGFCSDGTPCLCEDVEAKKNLKLPPLGMPLSPAASATSPDAPQSGIGSPWDEKRVSDTPGCTGNPGTCMQCQSDPMSTLFCTTVASRKQSATRSTLPEVEREPKYSPSTQIGGTYIPCSAAYQTLSRHKDFDRVDLGTLIGKLNTKGTQVEVSSVANVLRELDRKFYE